VPKLLHLVSRLPPGAATILLLVTISCTQPPSTGSVVLPPVPGGAARIWIYRNETPQDSQERPYLRLNGQIAGIAEPNGAFYRDVPPGRYLVSVDSYGVAALNQFAQVDLGAGQEAFVKVLSKREKVGGPEASRAAYFTRLVPADAARAAIAATPFYGTG
jgi:hypothetical protein